MAGVVRDDQGRPVAGATVVVGEFSAKPNHRLGTTGPDGRFDLSPSGASGRLDYVVVYKEGLAPASHFRMGLEDRAQERDVTLQLRKPAPFVGVVKDREGKPVVGAAVRMQTAQYPGSDGPKTLLNVIEAIVGGTPMEHLFRTTTDAQGVFRFPFIPVDAKASLVINAAGMGEYNTMNQPAPNGEFEYLAGTANNPAVVVLAPAARVVGRVMSRFRSVKTAGLSVALQGCQGSHGIWAETKTDAQGGFEFKGLAEGTANIFLKDQPNDGLWTYRAAADTKLRPGKAAEVTIELIRGVQVEGKVVDARNGKPVAEVGIGVYGPMRPRSGAAIASASTDNEGRYRFRLPPGQTYFYICGPVPAAYGPRPTPGGHTVQIPDGAHDFTVPSIEILPRSLQPRID
jgi:hypothetical protein